MALLATFLAAVPQDSSDRWEALTRYVEEAIARHAFPGAVVAVGRRDTILYLRAFGRLDYENGPPVVAGTGAPGHGDTGAEGAGTQRHSGTEERQTARSRTRPQTVYDLASLTKVVGLNTAIMMLVEEGRVALDSPVTRYLPEFAAGGDSVTVRDLLTHSSGLPAWKPFHLEARSREDLFSMVAAHPLEAPPRTRMVYSDLGAILLTGVVERVSRERLDRFLRRRVFGPLGMRETRFNPPRSWRRRIAPTEVDTTWRRRLVWGEVHDENTAAMGGVSGHAGLFGTASDLVRFAQFMLRDGRLPEGRRLLRAETIAEFTRVQQPGFSSRALGWDTPSEGSSAGTRLSPRSYGHTGFTGTSLWIDAERNLFVILLTNRVHPTRDNRQIYEVRPGVADLAVEAATRP
jgi:CubicO group peptidase (beta-lactamase class C family)